MVYFVRCRVEDRHEGPHSDRYWCRQYMRYWIPCQMVTLLKMTFATWCPSSTVIIFWFELHRYLLHNCSSVCKYIIKIQVLRAFLSSARILQQRFTNIRYDHLAVLDFPQKMYVILTHIQNTLKVCIHNKYNRHLNMSWWFYWDPNYYRYMNSMSQYETICDQWPLLLTWFNFNPGMDK